MQSTNQFLQAFAGRPRPLFQEILRSGTILEADRLRLRSLLATKTARELSPDELRRTVEGNLGVLTPAAFLYFLPTFLHASLHAFAALGNFAFELVGALTWPMPEDTVTRLERLVQARPSGLSAVALETLAAQQIASADSGISEVIFHERFDDVSPDEGAAIAEFLVALRAAHAAEFPFGEVDAALDRHWDRYRA